MKISKIIGDENYELRKIVNNKTESKFIMNKILFDSLVTEIKKIKNLAKELLEILKGKISQLDHWTEKEETQAEVENIIRDTLWCELPESYDDRLLNEYRRKIYEFVYSTYPAA